MLARPAPARPRVHIAEADYEKLSRLATDACSPGAALLGQELERATVVKNGQGPGAFVRLGSTVEFEDLLSGRVRTVTLVLPEASDMDENRLSVVAPAGAALLGLAPGDRFSWTVDGRPRLLVVNRILPPAASPPSARIGRRPGPGAGEWAVAVESAGPGEETRFPTLEAAVAFAEGEGWRYYIAGDERG